MFVKGYKKLVALFLASAFLLCGCGEQTPKADSPEQKSTQSESSSITPIATDGTWNGKGGCYKVQDPGLKESLYYVKIYKEEAYQLSIDPYSDSIKMDISLGDEVLYSTSSIDNIAVGDSGIWVFYDSTDYNTTSSREYTLLQLGFDKKEISRHIVTPYIDSYVRDMRCDKNGQVYMLIESSVIIFGTDGTYQSEIPIQGNPKRLVLGGDEKIYAITSNVENKEKNALSMPSRGKGGRAFALNTEEGKAEEGISYEEFDIFDGEEGFLFTVANEEGIYGVADSDKEMEPIALWEELGAGFTKINFIGWLAEGRILLSDTNMMAVLIPAEPSEIKPKEIITMAGISSLNGFQNLIAGFNLQNEHYVVKYEDYSQNHELTVEEAINKLNMDILAGNIPDIFDFSEMTMEYYANKGLVEDIYPYLDQENGISRDDFMLLNKLEDNGKLYAITPSYYLEVMLGLKSRFGEQNGWTLDDYLDIQKEYSGEIIYNNTKRNFLWNLLYNYVGDNIHWETKTCDFESDDFLKILNTADQIRENPEPQDSSLLDYTPAGVRLKNNTLIVAYWYMDSVKGLAEAIDETKEPLSYIGWPTPDGSNGNRIGAFGLVGMSSKGNTDGAWEFLKYMMTEGAEKENRYGISINRAVFEEQVQKVLMEAKEDENAVPCNQEIVDQFYEILENATFRTAVSDQIMNIIMEEAEAFFAGDKTAEDTAHIIQSRVGLMIAEQ